MFEFLGAVAGGLFSAGASILGTLAPLWNIIHSGFTAVYNALSTVGTFLWSTLKKVGAFLDHLWTRFFKQLFTNLLHHLGRVYSFLHKYAAMAFKYIHRVQQFLDRYYKQYLRPQLIMMQRMRQVLGIFRLVHIHTFDKLDKYLAHTQAQMIGAFLEVRGYVNLVAGFVNQLASPLGVLKLVLYGAAGPRQAAAAVRVFTGLPIGWFFPNYHKNAQPWERPVTSSRQLLDSSSNPPPSQLLGGLDFLTPDSFTEANPVPSDAELDSQVPPYMFGDALALMEASDAALLMDTGDPLSIVELVTQQQGFLADAGQGGAQLALALVAGA